MYDFCALRNTYGVSGEQARDIAETMAPRVRETPRVNVVLFTGGRGSRALSTLLIHTPQVRLTLAINGYDDGASTGEVRRFLGDSLGPSDYRKNASWLAGELHACSPALIALLDLRLPVPCSWEEAGEVLDVISGHRVDTNDACGTTLQQILHHLNSEDRQQIAHKLGRFRQALTHSGRAFVFADCSLGNLVFTGCFLERGRDFNAAIAEYCRLLHLPDSLIENVTDGTNAYLMALDSHNHLLGSEAEIVEAHRRHQIKDLYLLDRPLTAAERQWVLSVPVTERLDFLEKRSQVLTPNARVLDRLAEADVIIYAPGTQHSSLLPSYLTPGLGRAIAQNLTALKLLITNLREDVEIPDSTAVDLIHKAVYYLQEKGRLAIPTPCLITHYLINDPGRTPHGMPYVAPGRLEALADPRVVCLGKYEAGATGRHDAATLLTPFLESCLQHSRPLNIAVLLLDAVSPDKITQTIFAMLRAGIQRLPLALTLLYDSPVDVETLLGSALPFDLVNMHVLSATTGASWRQWVDARSLDYLIFFEASGMYQGEDIVQMASLLIHRRIDAVWGRRRRATKAHDPSYTVWYRSHSVLGALRWLGRHLLSLTYVLLYGRYIADPLSGVRAMKAAYLPAAGFDLHSKCVNHHLLAMVLRAQADLCETSVTFFPLAPAHVRRTTVMEGIQCLVTMIGWRLKARKHRTAQRPV
jgi:2-phospho-L-lactate transferase/gluconeogenesis factor (CofD/UPF0052 family)